MFISSVESSNLAMVLHGDFFTYVCKYFEKYFQMYWGINVDYCSNFFKEPLTEKGFKIRPNFPYGYEQQKQIEFCVLGAECSQGSGAGIC